MNAVPQVALLIRVASVRVEHDDDALNMLGLDQPNDLRNDRGMLVTRTVVEYASYARSMIASRCESNSVQRAFNNQQIVLRLGIVPVRQMGRNVQHIGCIFLTVILGELRRFDVLPRLGYGVNAIWIVNQTSLILVLSKWEDIRANSAYLLKAKDAGTNYLRCFLESE